MKINLNRNFQNLEKSYLFAEIAHKIEEFSQKNPEKQIISLGIGDVTLPLSPFVSKKMSQAAQNLSSINGFVGYGDTLGLPSLRQAISNRYKSRQIDIENDEIFVSDGAKSDLGNLCDVLGDNEIVICDPVYPVYFDSNVISGRKIRIVSANKENNFVPSPKNLPNKPFVVYLCSPNNPTGAVFSQEQLGEWVDFAIKSGSLIIFDAAYEGYIQNKFLPHSIFEIENAKKCAIEVCSFSKSAGFTGVRCGWSVIPRNLELNALWKRRQNTKFNGASYISQIGALAALSPRGENENAKNIQYYMENAQKIASFLKEKQIFFVGGENAPYLWLEIPKKKTSWEFFDYLLLNTGVVGTPGVGFGKNGEGFFRLSAFASRENVNEALCRLGKIL